MNADRSGPALTQYDDEAASSGARVRLGAVEYLNARPLVWGLDASDSFGVRFDLPSRCASLLHEGAIDLGLVPAIEYLRGPASSHGAARRPYWIVPDVAIASRGPVASVALYTTRAPGDIRSIALDTSSRSSVALARVLSRRYFRIEPAFEAHAPRLDAMLSRCDAAVIIGDEALFLEGGLHTVGRRQVTVEKIDLGEAWTAMTGLPFVYAFWAGPERAVTPVGVRALQRVRDAGVEVPDAVARRYFGAATDRTAAGARYLRENIKYTLGADERAGLELFFRYASEVGAVDAVQPLRFFEAS